MADTSPTAPRAAVVPADAARTLLEGPLGAQLLAGDADTAGQVAFVIHPLAARALGSPVHTHQREDEWSYVLEGAVGVELGGATLVAGTGDLVLKPRGVPHAFWNAGDDPARILEVITPAGFERYFERLGTVLAASPEEPIHDLLALATEHGLEVDLRSVPRLVQAHGLRM